MRITLQRLVLGRQFAAALDACDYVRAAEFLADHCSYARRGQETLVGPSAICDSYRESDVRARRVFDTVKYRSEATEDAFGGVRLTFFDELESGSARHTFRCSQIAYFDENQKIERIELAEIAGENDRLSEFCAAHGIQLH
jgi:hypothetical protein